MSVVFLQTLQSYSPLPLAHVDALGSLYHFSNDHNAEIRLRFYEVALQDSSSTTAKKYTPEALNWVTGADGTGVVKGRMKFCRPIFQKTGDVDHDLAVKMFREYQKSYHPIAQKLIEKVRHFDNSV
jgi:leukotriene-A4 hydrolase